MSKKKGKKIKNEDLILYFASLPTVVIYGKVFDRVRYRGENGKNCPGCHKLTGHLHDLCCPEELCPCCKGAAIGCLCDPDIENAVKDNFIECLDNPL